MAGAAGLLLAARVAVRVSREGRAAMSQETITYLGPGGVAARPEDTTHEFRFLGTSSGLGIPSFFCHCPACEEARAHPEYARCCSAAIVMGRCNLLIDTPPDLRIELVREGIDSIAGLAYTHTHYDHFGSLGELDYYVHLNTGVQIPTYVGWRGHDEIASANGYMLDCLDRHLIEPFQSFEFDDVVYQAIPATHAPGTFGWLMTFPAGTTLLYMCDTATLSDEAANAIRGRVDVIAWDATCWGTNLAPENHHNAQQAVDEAAELGASQIYLTHLAPHYADIPACHDDMEAFANQYEGHVHIAYDGLRLRL